MELTTKQNQQLIKSIKAGKTQPECARDLGVTPGQLGMLQFCKAQVEAGVVAKAPNSEASYKKLRAAGARWELISAQTGASVAVIKAAVGADTPGPSRGRNAGGGKAPAKAGTARGKTGVQTVARGKAGTKPAPARARTRAERAARSGNPS